MCARLLFSLPSNAGAERKLATHRSQRRRHLCTRVAKVYPARAWGAC